MCEVYGTRITGPDLRRRVDHGDYRKRICEMIKEAGILIDRPGDHSGRWQDGYELLTLPVKAVSLYLEQWTPRKKVSALEGLLESVALSNDLGPGEGRRIISGTFGSGG